MFPFQDLPRIVLLGVGATIVMDVWLLALTRLGVQTLNFAFLGRWVGHLARGRFAHHAIAKADPIPAEALVGWTAHYAVGVGFAGLLVGIHGVEWARYPTLIPALLFGAGTVVIPLFVMQPAMGAGFAGYKTPSPFRNSIRSLANHIVFGAGLFLAANLVNWASR